MQTIFRSWPFVFAAVFAAQTAFADTPPTDLRTDLPEPARRAWDAAKQLAGASDYKGALVEFQRAYELSHNPRVLYNVGVTEKLLTHYARAVDAWDKELHEGAAGLSAAEVQELKNAIGIVQQFVTTIDVTSSEPDAALWVDDYAAGKTPFTAPVRIDVGKHVLKLSKAGFVDAIQTVDVASATRTPVSFKLDPTSKTALVTVTVGGAPGATLFVDGRDVGPAPFKGELSAERHTIEARSPGFLTVGETVDVHYEQALNLTIALSSERHIGRLHIVAPEGADIAIDAHTVGTGTWEGVVSSRGGHQLVVHKSGYQTYSTEVFVADDQVRDVSVPLNREVSTNWVAWGVGTLVVVTGSIVVGYFVFKPASTDPFVGDLGSGLATAHHRIHF